MGNSRRRYPDTALYRVQEGNQEGRQKPDAGVRLRIDQVKAQAYPNMLITIGLHDSQVQYWEPAKWVAKLCEMKTDDNALLLRTNMETGHGGASGGFQVYHEIAQEYAFLLDLAEVSD